MIKAYLKPLLKRFIGLFISMSIVTLMAISLMVCFLTSLSNLGEEFDSYRAEYGSFDGVVDTSLASRADLEKMEGLPEIEKVETRLVAYANVVKADGRIITCRVLTHKEEDTLSRLYFVESDPLDGSPDLYVESAYSKNNGFALGSNIEIGYFGFFVNCRVGAIVKSPESLYVAAEDYIWSDNIDFGYIYISESVFDGILSAVADKVMEEIANNPEYANYYQDSLDSIGDLLPDLLTLGEKYVQEHANQTLIKAAPGYDGVSAIEAAAKYLSEQGYTVKGKKNANEIPSFAYMERCVKQLDVAGVFLPVFFFGIALLVTSLFINQIVKSLTPEIGTMVSIGISPAAITRLLSVFVLLMSLLSLALGIGAGYGLLRITLFQFVAIYNLPTISEALSFPIILLAGGLSILIGQLSVLLSASRVYAITPKDAMLNNEAKRKPISPSISAFLEKLPPITRLGFHSVLQNKRRFFVSVFSMFASFTLIGLTSNFYVSKNTVIAQTVSYRMGYDVQTYVMGSLPEGLMDDILSDGAAKMVEEAEFTYLPVTAEGKSIHIRSMGIEENRSEMIVIPDENGKGNLASPSKGMILDSYSADQLNVKIGDTILINKKPILVEAISKQYSNAISYLRRDALRELGVQHAMTILAQVDDQAAYTAYLQERGVVSVSVFSSNLAADYGHRLGGVDVMIYILIAISFLMGFAILSIMGQNALMEQKKQICIMRGMGFQLLGISNLWTVQSIAQLVLATIAAVPATIGFSAVLFNMAGTAGQRYPLVFSFPVYLIAFGFVLLSIVISHLLCMKTVAKWNLADATRSRE